MASCTDCGTKIGFFDISEMGKCSACTFAHRDKQKAEMAEQRKEAAAAEETLRSVISSVMVTTETHLSGQVRERKKVIVAAVDSAFDAKFVEKHEELTHALKTEAHLAGANAVIGVTFNVVETYAATLGVGEFKRFKLVAFGTAVDLET